MKDLTRCNKYMFRKVLCKAYMKKVNDGRYIAKSHSDEHLDCDYVYGVDENGKEIVVPVPEPYDGSYDLLKTYYERKVKGFAGVVVGMKMIVATGYLTVDTVFENTTFGRCENEKIVFGKQPKDQVKCALVYYGCNRSRYVPIEDLEIMEE